MMHRGIGGRVRRKADAVRSRLASRYYVTLGRAEPELIFIAGTGRSGTTWLAELLARNSRRRLIFEPFRNDRVPLWEGAAARQYIRPGDTATELLEPARRIMGGELRNPWSDYYNERFLTRGLIIKDIRANLMLRWLYEQFDSFPLVFLVRHPGAVVASWMRERWTLEPVEVFLHQSQLVQDHLGPHERQIRSATDALERVAYAWCIETLVPLSQFRREEMTVVFYEDLIVDPLRELTRIAGRVGEPLGMRAHRSIAMASSTTTPGVSYGSQLERLLAWRSIISSSELDRITSITSRFGLDRLHGRDGMPAMEADDVLESLGLPANAPHAEHRPSARY